jgi:hypothetical protein
MAFKLEILNMDNFLIYTASCTLWYVLRHLFYLKNGNWTLNPILPVGVEIYMNFTQRVMQKAESMNGSQ